VLFNLHDYGTRLKLIFARAAAQNRGMSLDPGLLFLSLITSGIGFVLFIYGKKQQRWPQLLGGIVMMVYPYFVSTLLMNVVLALVIVAAVWLAIRQGY